MRQPSIYLPMMSHRSVSSVLRGAIRSTDHDFLRVFPFQYLESPEAPRASHRRGDSPAFIQKKKQLKKTTIWIIKKLVKFAPMLPGAAQLSRPVTNNRAIKPPSSWKSNAWLYWVFFSREKHNLGSGARNNNNNKKIVQNVAKVKEVRI